MVMRSVEFVANRCNVYPPQSLRALNASKSTSCICFELPSAWKDNSFNPSPTVASRIFSAVSGPFDWSLNRRQIVSFLQSLTLEHFGTGDRDCLFDARFFFRPDETSGL